MCVCVYVYVLFLLFYHQEIGDSPDMFGLYMPTETMEVAIGDEDLLSSHNVTSAQELIFKPLPMATSFQATSMILKVCTLVHCVCVYVCMYVHVHVLLCAFV
jgi:hypothetical protein